MGIPPSSLNNPLRAAISGEETVALGRNPRPLRFPMKIGPYSLTTPTPPYLPVMTPIKITIPHLPITLCGSCQAGLSVRPGNITSVGIFKRATFPKSDKNTPHKRGH